jgi:hypothetical protein
MAKPKIIRELKNAESKLVNNNLLREERYGKMFLVKSGPNFERVRKDFQSLWTGSDYRENHRSVHEGEHGSGFNYSKSRDASLA